MKKSMLLITLLHTLRLTSSFDNQNHQKDFVLTSLIITTNMVILRKDQRVDHYVHSLQRTHPEWSNELSTFTKESKISSAWASNVYVAASCKLATEDNHGIAIILTAVAWHLCDERYAHIKQLENHLRAEQLHASYR